MNDHSDDKNEKLYHVNDHSYAGNERFCHQIAHTCSLNERFWLINNHSCQVQHGFWCINDHSCRENERCCFVNDHFCAVNEDSLSKAYHYGFFDGNLYYKSIRFSAAAENIFDAACPQFTMNRGFYKFLICCFNLFFR